MPELRSPSVQAVLLAMAIAATYLFMDTRATLWDRDEPRFARATAEMVASGDYLVPTFNGQLRPDKPILIYWLMSLPMRVLGPTELACRFFGSIGTALACWLTFFIGKRLLNPSVGLRAMAILATSLMMLYMGTAATADGVLLPFMVAQMAVFVGFATSTRRGWAQVLLGLAVGGALLAKGPVGVLPVLSLAVMLGCARRQYPTVWRLRELTVAASLGLALFLLWALPANAATEGEFYRQGIGHHVLSRAAKPLEHHGGRFLLYLPYYVPVILIGLFPWTLFLPGALSACLGGRLGGTPFRSLFLAWTVPLLIVMTLVATKLPHYILFIWPMAALAIGATLDAARHGPLAQQDLRWLRRGAGLFLAMSTLSGLALIAAPWADDLSALFIHRLTGLFQLLFYVGMLDLPPATMLCGLVLLGEAVAALWVLRTSKLEYLARVLVAGTLAFLLLFLLCVMPAIETLKISPAIARIIREEGRDPPPTATYDYAEPTLNFYIGARLDPLGSREALQTWLEDEGPGLLIISQRALTELAAEGMNLDLETLGSKRGFNYTKGDTMEIHVLKR